MCRPLHLPDFQRGRAVVGCAGGDGALVAEIGIVDVGIRAVRAARDAGAGTSGIVKQQRGGAFGVTAARIAFVADSINDRASAAYQCYGTRGVDNEVIVWSDVEVTIRGV